MNGHMKALLEIYKRAPSNGEDVSYLIAKNALIHTHVHCRDGVKADGDECLLCGLDIRDQVHKRATS